MKVIFNHKGSGEAENMQYPYFGYHKEYPNTIYLCGMDSAIVVLGSEEDRVGSCWYDPPYDVFIPLPANSLLTLQNEVRVPIKKLKLG